MKTKSLFPVFFSLVFLTGILLTSCEKNAENNVSGEDVELAEDEAFIDMAFEDIMSEADAMEAVSFKSTEVGCASVTLENADNVWTITIDYGEGCEQLIQNRFGQVIDTITRKGKVHIERNGLYLQQGSYRTVTLENYSINGIQVQGTRTVTNMGLDQNLHMWFTVELQNGQITTPDGIVITRNSHRERHWVAGEDTPSPIDDQYRIWGTVDGITAGGEQYSCTIIDSLQINMACRLMVGGQVEIVVGDREPFTLNYGNGDCDATATLERDGQTRQINLRYHARLRVARIIRAGNNQ